MVVEEEEELMRRVLEESVNNHDEDQWHGLEVMMALSAALDVAIPPELQEAAVVKEEEDAIVEPPSKRATPSPHTASPTALSCCFWHGVGSGRSGVELLPLLARHRAAAGPSTPVATS